MRKHIFGRQLQRDVNERKALFKSLMSALVIDESIQTTEAKAKAIKGQIEKLTTIARVGGQNAERALSAYFSHPVMKKLLNEIAPLFANRPGGYTRIIKTGNRLRDNAKMVLLEWVERPTKKVASEVVGQEAPKTEKIQEAEEVKKTVKKPAAKKSPKGTSLDEAAEKKVAKKA